VTAPAGYQSGDGTRRERAGELYAGTSVPARSSFRRSRGYTFLHHAPDDSFPSDHGTVIFTFALAFLFWHRLWSGALLMVVAAAIAWSRVYLGVHWPLDMVGGSWWG
jgi:undecaprenyl-diphosphatase